MPSRPVLIGRGLVPQRCCAGPRWQSNLRHQRTQQCSYPAFPADCPHPPHCHYTKHPFGVVVRDTRVFQHIARFIDSAFNSTVSRRSKPSSRTALMGEQPNPWERLHPQDATSRHRGAKPSRRYGLLGKISLLSPGYLLSVERRRFHMPAPDH